MLRPRRRKWSPMIEYVFRRVLLALIILLVIVVVFQKEAPLIPKNVRVHYPTWPKNLPTQEGPQQCQPNLTTLQDLGLANEVDYARINVAVKFSKNTKMPKQGYTQLDVPLPKSQTVFLTSDYHDDEHLCGENIVLELPQPSTSADASHMVIGLATMLNRLNDSIPAFAQWAAHTGVHFYALVPPPETSTPKYSISDVLKVEQRAREFGFNLEIRTSEMEYDDRYFSLLSLLAEYRKPTTKWGLIMDDDTFFLSMPNLLSLLAKYDDKEMHYVGGLSEDMIQIGYLGPIAFGGAGIFVSAPLLDALQPHVNECMDWREQYPTGDSRIAACIAGKTGVTLEWEEKLHQLDIRGDASGFFESGREQPVSVHHWKSWFQVPMEKVALVSKACGEECLLRRWRFKDGWYLTNGYSIVKYWDEEEVKAGKKLTMEKTWYEEIEWESKERYAHSLEPLRPKDLKKASMRLEDAVVEGDVVRQFYVRRGDAERNDRVVEVVWQRQ